MAKGLVIVESPAKAKTIQKYLGKGYTVEASLGHVKDLPKSTLGVDIDNEFDTEYIVIPGKEKVLTKLKKLAESADHIYLAPDPDREGEAIAAHLADELDTNGSKKKKKSAKKDKNNKALQDAREAQQYGGAKFDGSKVKTNTPVQGGGQKPAPDLKALNKAEQQRQAVNSQKYHLDKPNKPVPPPPPPPKNNNNNKKK